MLIEYSHCQFGYKLDLLPLRHQKFYAMTTNTKRHPGIFNVWTQKIVLLRSGHLFCALGAGKTEHLCHLLHAGRASIQQEEAVGVKIEEDHVEPILQPGITCKVPFQDPTNSSFETIHHAR